VPQCPVAGDAIDPRAAVLSTERRGVGPSTGQAATSEISVRAMVTRRLKMSSAM